MTLLGWALMVGGCLAIGLIVALVGTMIQARTMTIRVRDALVAVSGRHRVYEDASGKNSCDCGQTCDVLARYSVQGMFADPPEYGDYRGIVLLKSGREGVAPPFGVITEVGPGWMPHGTVYYAGGCFSCGVANSDHCEHFTESDRVLAQAMIEELNLTLREAAA